MLVSLTVGKVDAGVAVLLTEDNRLIEFPSVLLPRNITSGSIVNINVSRNFAAEEASVASFKRLQDNILTKYGLHSPSAPVLRLRNATQTSIVLSWDPINLATATLRSLALYRNDSKAGNIPRPFEMQSTKISGLAIDTEYTFHLVLRTSAGTYSSQKLKCRTHKMTDLSGIAVTPGIMPPAVRVSLGQALERIGGKIIDNVRIDTTHFVCTEAGGDKWEKAVKQNIPVVRPEWVDGCEREGTIVSVRGYYLDADPRMRQIGSNVRRQSTVTTAASTTRTESPLPPTPKESNSFAKRAGSINNTSNNNMTPQMSREPPLQSSETNKPEDTEQKQEASPQPSSSSPPPASANTAPSSTKPEHSDLPQPSFTAKNVPESNPQPTSSDGPVNGTAGKEQSPYAEDKPIVQEPPTSPPVKDEHESEEEATSAVNGQNGVQDPGLPIRGKSRKDQAGSEGENLEEVPL